MSRRAWRRTTALILGWTALVTLVYSGFLPAPVLDDVVWLIAGLGWKPFWVAVAVGELAIAIGVMRHYRWARTIAILFGAWLLALGASGVIGLVAQGQWPNPSALVDGVLGILVLYGMGARWSPRPRPAEHESESEGEGEGEGGTPPPDRTETPPDPGAVPPR